jgi:hypothetical protein
VTDFFVTIELLGFVRTLKSSFFVYPVVNALHIASIGMLLTSVVLIDLRVLGAFRSLPEKPFVGVLRRLAYVALTGAVLTGLLLFSVRASEYVGMPIFLAKIALILVAALNFLAFLYASRTGAGKTVVATFALLSLVLWPSVLLAGRFIGFL